MLNLLVFSFPSSRFIPDVIDNSTFFISLGLLVETFFFTSSDSLTGPQQWLRSLQDPSISVLYLMKINIAFRALAVLFHSGAAV